MPREIGLLRFSGVAAILLLFGTPQASELRLGGQHGTADSVNGDAVLVQEFGKQFARYSEYLNSGPINWSDSTATGKVLFRRPDCWFFNKNSLTYMLSRELSATKIEEKNMGLISSLARSFKTKGIDLIVVPLPGKTDLYGDKVVPGVKHPIPNPLYYWTLRRLEVEHIEYVNVLDTMQRMVLENSNAAELFLRSYDFLSPRGVSIVAEEVSRKIREMPWYLGCTKTYFSRRASKDAYFADVATRGVPEACAKQDVEFTRVFDKAGKPFRPTANAPIIVTGQYSRLYEDMISSNSGLPSLIADNLSCSLDWVVQLIDDLPSLPRAIGKRIGESTVSPKVVILVVDMVALCK